MQVQFGGVTPTYVDPLELRSRLGKGEAFTIVDARSAQEFGASGLTIRGAVRLPPQQLSDRWHEIPKGRTTLLLADRGQEEWLAQQLLDLGFTDVYLIEGGFNAFAKVGGQVVPNGAR